MLRNEFSSVPTILQLKVCISKHSWFGLQVAMLVANPIIIFLHHNRAQLQVDNSAFVLNYLQLQVLQLC